MSGFWFFMRHELTHDKDRNRWVAECLDTGLVTSGKTESEALENLEKARALYPLCDF